MTDTGAWPWPHFSFAEMRCRGENCCGGRYACKPELMDALEQLRAAVDAPLPVTSGYRCPVHNVRVSNKGTGPNGPHVQGLAADIACDGQLAYRILSFAPLLGFTGIGVAVEKGFVHLDLLQPPDWPRPTVWGY